MPDDPTETDTTETETAEIETEGRKPPREQRYRVERNQAREERDALAARLETMQTREVERLAADLAQPGDLLTLGGVTLAELLGEAGDVEPEAVAEAVAALLEQRPGLSKTPRVGATDPTQGQGSTGKPPLAWSDLFNN